MALARRRGQRGAPVATGGAARARPRRWRTVQSQRCGVAVLGERNRPGRRWSPVLADERVGRPLDAHVDSHGAASAPGAANSSATPANRPDRNLCIYEPPLPRGFSALWSEGGLLASGPTSRAFPDRTWRPSGCGSLEPRALGIPGHSGGSAPVLHRLPCPPTLDLRAGCYRQRDRHDRQSDPHLHAPRRRRRDASRRHEPGAQDAPADRGLRHRRRAQRAARRRAHGARAAGRATPSGCGGSRTTCSTSAPTSRSPRAASASGCACGPSRPHGSRRPATRSTPTCRR